MKPQKSLILTFILILMFSINLLPQSWEKINTGYNFILMGIEFPGNQSSIGYAGGESVTYMGDGIVIKTTNGGTSWTQLWTGTDQGIEGISFPDLNTGYVCGWSGYFAKTTDGGVTWTPQTPGTDIYFYTEVIFKDTQHGVAFAQTNSGAGVYVTSNGGTSWTTATGVAGIPYGACYVSGSTYYLVTNGGSIQRSVDDGLTWTTVFSGGGLLLGIDFYNSNIGIAAGEDGWIFKTYDGGTTWQPQQTAFGNPLWHDFAWATQSDVYSVGTPETIWRSTDGGATWTNDYPQSTYNPALYEIIHTADDILYICGSQGWFYRKAAPLNAVFTVSDSTICAGQSVQFTDQSLGDPTSWSWVFEGGTPPVSSLQNPTVTYVNPGSFDVTLTVTRGSLNSVSVHPDMMQVATPLLSAPSQPSGPVDICGLYSYDYVTTAVPDATSYQWTTDPATAGTFSGTGLTGTLAAANTWQGTFDVKVSAVNACGPGPQSIPLNVDLYLQPNPYFLFGGGGYCPGSAGYEVKLEDSDVGVDYELFKDGVTTGQIFSGTGNALSFGLQPAGTYTVTGTAGNCFNTMNGSCIVYLIDLPGQASTPTGPLDVCSNETSTYAATFPANAFSLVWDLTPPEAGTITSSGLSATINWSGTFSGIAYLSVSGENECGTGVVSNPLEITVHPTPYPVITGDTLVCLLALSMYEVSDNSGSTYDWTVTGGLMISGQGTNQISVLWGAPGTGTIQVTESTDSGCSGSSDAFDVIIEICPGIPETGSSSVSIYPNPTTSQLVIVKSSTDYIFTSYRISELMSGRMMQQDQFPDMQGPAVIEVDNLANGTYLLTITAKQGITINKYFSVLR